METTSDIVIGQVVRSKAGRDKGKIFIVIDIIDDLYVLVADGDYRKLDNPKKKKIRHLVVYKSIINEINKSIKNGDKIDNSFVRKALKPFTIEI